MLTSHLGIRLEKVECKVYIIIGDQNAQRKGMLCRYSEERAKRRVVRISKRVFEKYQTPLKFVIMFNYWVYGTKIIPQRFKRCRMANH